MNNPTLNPSSSTQNIAVTLQTDSSNYTRKELTQFIDKTMKLLRDIGSKSLELAYHNYHNKLLESSPNVLRLYLYGSPKDIAELKKLIDLQNPIEIKHYIFQYKKTTNREDKKFCMIIATKKSNYFTVNDECSIYDYI